LSESVIYKKQKINYHHHHHHHHYHPYIHLSMSMSSSSCYSRTIVTVFAGRRENLEIQRQYFDRAMELKLIDEVHYWNYTRCESDDQYLRSRSNLKYTSADLHTKYTEIYPWISSKNNDDEAAGGKYDDRELEGFDISVRGAEHDFHLCLRAGDHSYEIVMGGWANKNSVIRSCKEGQQIFAMYPRQGVLEPARYVDFRVSICRRGSFNFLCVRRETTGLILQTAIPASGIEQVMVKTGCHTCATIRYTPVMNRGYYLMDRSEAKYTHWNNYYEYYARNNDEYVHDILVKCDDDIVFLDVDRLESYLTYVRAHAGPDSAAGASRSRSYDLVFANTINNGVAAYHQQNTLNLIPRELMELEMPAGGFCGSLWESGKKAETLHRYFVENSAAFFEKKTTTTTTTTDSATETQVIDIPTRFSINFFAIHGSKWPKIRDCGDDDELHLTVTFVENRGFRNAMFIGFVVSHLSFYKQVETNMDSFAMRQLYQEFARKQLTN
jgi:phosphoribosyl-AMP cyclohydrolase